MWVETESLSFTARHEEADDESAQRTLDALEDLRLKLEDRFDVAPGDVTVVVHPSPAWLNAAHPFLPAARLAAAPAGRRYLAGWAMARELHVLNDDYLDKRAAGEDSLAALRGTAERLYAQIVIGSNNHSLPPPWGPRRFSRYLRWSWLVEGGAQYFAGQVPLFRPAVQTRMRAGNPPVFPPSAPRRDHPRRHGLRPARAPAREGCMQPPHLAHPPRRARARDPDRVRRVSARRRPRMAALPARGRAARGVTGRA